MNIQCLDIYGNTHTFDESEYIERLAIYGVHIKNNQVLLVRDMWAKHWEFPGGGIDEGETPEQALQRELMEETGLHLEKLLEPLAVHESYFLGPDEPKPWKSKRVLYSMDVEEGPLKHNGNNEDVLEVKYIPVDELKNILNTTHKNSLIPFVFKNHINSA